MSAVTVLSLLRCGTKTLEPSRPCLRRTKSPSRISFAHGVGRLAVPGLGDPRRAGHGRGSRRRRHGQLLL